MQLSVSGEGVKISDEVYSDIDRRLRFALGRFGTAIGRVVVRVVDINGPRGGADKQCRITVALRGIGSDSISVDYFGDKLNTSIVRACERAERAVRRTFERKRAKYAYHRRRIAEVESK